MNRILLSVFDVAHNCLFPQFWNDGICDDINNEPECHFDGGDCCNENSHFGLCHDCVCYNFDGFQHSLDNCSEPQLVGDGMCDDLTNTPECQYDQGDCCLDSVLNLYCTHCICYLPYGDEELVYKQIEGSFGVFRQFSVAYLVARSEYKQKGH